jgi:lipopolysaccharide export system permease protein
MGNDKVVIAESGKMAFSDDELNLMLTLYNGNSYEEKIKKTNNTETHPLVRTTFKEETIRFDLSAFKLTRTDEELFKDNYQMLNIKQLRQAEDTLNLKLAEREKDFRENLGPFFYFKRDTTYYLKDSTLSRSVLTVPPSAKSFINTLKKEDRIRILETAMNLARSAKAYIDVSQEEFDIKKKLIVRHQIEWHRKFTLSFACMVLFFIGAPLGAIIRKGGLGMPMVVSTFFFIIFHVISITGEKFAKEGVLTPLQGMWLASFLLLPLGVFLTFKATSDSVLFDNEAYGKLVKKFFKKKLPK